MFLLAGVENRSKNLQFYDDEMHVCKRCGNECNYEFVLFYDVLKVFLLPLIRWKKKYYAKSSCCQTYFLIPEKVGYLISKGRLKIIRDMDIQYSGESDFYKHCSFCNYESPHQYNYCPRCGRKYQ